MLCVCGNVWKCAMTLVLLCSQGQAIIIASSDLIMFHFYLHRRVHRVHRVQMDSLLHCQEMFARTMFHPLQTHKMLYTQWCAADISNKFVQLCVFFRKNEKWVFPFHPSASLVTAPSALTGDCNLVWSILNEPRSTSTGRRIPLEQCERSSHSGAD